MGTRGNVIIKTAKKGITLVNIYHHMDSYPEGLGAKLDEFLTNRVVVNGINLAEKRKISNGMSDLAAQLVCLLKVSPEYSGGVYIENPKWVAKYANNYTYIIYPVTDKKSYMYEGKEVFYDDPTGPLRITVYEHNKIIFDGSTDEYSKFITNYNG